MHGMLYIISPGNCGHRIASGGRPNLRCGGVCFLGLTCLRNLNWSAPKGMFTIPFFCWEIIKYFRNSKGNKISQFSQTDISFDQPSGMYVDYQYMSEYINDFK